MNNADEILKRILLNMKYDSRKSLNENKITIDNLLIKEQAQQIPTTMNQIMQFQTYIWKRVDKNPDPTTITDKTKKYNSKLCNAPCTVYNNNVNGKIYPGAIDGTFGNKTRSLWETYKESYKKYNPNWDKNDVKTQEKVLGQTIPTSSTQIKNFQKWYLEQKEKSKPNSKNLYTTKLCSSPCTKGQAIDGSWGKNTKSVWQTYGEEYKKNNQNWSVSVSWSKEDQDAQELLKQRSDLSKIFRWTTQNPSGWNMVDPIPNAISSNISTKYAKLNPKDCQFYYGWNGNESTFPAPRKYTDQELKQLFTATGGDKKYQEKLKEKAKSDKEFEENSMGSTNMGALQTGETWRISDRLGYDRYTPDPLGQGETGFGKKVSEHNTYWDKQLADSRNKIYDGAVEWNKMFDKVSSEINSKCGTPLKICQTINENNTKSNCVYISYSDVCRNAGGLWVYEPKTNNAWCGCRSMLDPQLSNTSTTSGSMFEFNGPNGKFVSTIAFGHTLEWQTPETGGKIREEREKSHATLGKIELALSAVGFVSGPFAPLFFGAAGIVGFVDGVKYWNEGDTHMGLMMMSLSLLGGPEIVSAFKLAKAELSAIKLVSTYGDDGLKTLINTYKSSPEILGAAELNAIKILKQATYTSQRILGKEMSKKMLSNFARNLPKIAKEQKWGWKQFIKVFWNFAESQPTLKGTLVYIGGIPYTLDQIYLALYGNDLDRQRSGIGALFDYLSKRPQEAQIVLDKAFIEFQSQLVIESATIQKFEEMMKSIMDSSGNIDLNKLESDEEVLARLRKEGKISETGFDQQRYDEIVKSRNEAENKVGCDKLNSLKELGWSEITKIESTKEKSKGTPAEYLVSVECDGVKYLINKTKDYMEKIYPKTNTGQPPINNSMISNTNG